MNLDYYNFKQNPFLTTPDLNHLFLSPRHDAALRAIIDGIQKRSGVVVLTGPEGVGKTTVLQAFLHRSDPKVLKTTGIEPPTVSYPDIVAVVAEVLGLDAQTDDVEALLDQVHSALIEEYQAGRIVALVIDEVQHMSLDTLASLWRLITSEYSQVNLLQIVMAGSTEFKNILNQKGLRFLKRHVSVHATLSPLTKTESRAYIHAYLAKATEAPKTIFSRNALKHIVTHARGAPGILNILCVDVLLLGAYRNEQPISAKTVKDVIADWESASLTSYLSRRLVGTIGVMVAIVVLGLFWFSLPKTFFTVKTDASSSPPPDRTTRVAQSKIVAPLQPSLPSTGDERQVAKAKPQASLSQPQIEAADGEDKTLKILKDQESESPLASQDAVAKRETTISEVAVKRQAPSPLPQKVQTEPSAADPAAMQAQRPPRGANDNAWLYTQHPEHYSVQLVSTGSETAAQRYIERKQLGSQAAYFHARTTQGKDWYYVLYGSFETQEEAEAVRQRINKSAWIRRFGVLQKNRCAVAALLPPQQSLEVQSFCATPG